ncbi:MAG: NAD(P)/FAD-dependent oxidoreductase [Nitrospinae bacterium]|nr:NAD(P)/FAD-dependent oxidoreductase [Nitrospinota bacterium]
MNDIIEYDLVVLGGGTAGRSAAKYAAEKDTRVCLVHNDLLPFSIFWEMALSASAGSIDLAGIREAAREDWAKKLAALKNAEISMESGSGILINNTQVSIQGREGNKIVKAKSIIIATGSRAKPNLVIPFDGQRIISSDDIAGLDSFPDNILVVSGGKTGCEIAKFLKCLGKKVFLCDEHAKLIPEQDPEISSALEEGLKNQKIKLLLDRKIQSIFKEDEKINITLNGGIKFSVAMIVFTGKRCGNTSGLGIDDIGVRLGENDEVWVNENMETSIAGVYAVGSVTGRGRSNTMSEEEGKVAASNALGIPASLNPDHIPLIIQVDPEIACVGCYYDSAHYKGYRGVEGRSGAIAGTPDDSAGETSGLCMVLADKSSKKIIGVQICGNSAEEAIRQAAKAIKEGLTVSGLLKNQSGFKISHPGFVKSAKACLKALKTGMRA